MEVARLTAEMAFDLHQELGREIEPDAALDLEEGGGYALYDDKGVFAIGGIHPLRPMVGIAWTLMGRRWRRYARQVTGLCRFGLNRAPYARIEAATATDWPAGRRWLEGMGFTLECERAVKWDGVNDYALFVRLNDGIIASSRRSGGGIDSKHDRLGVLGNRNGSERGHVDSHAHHRIEESGGHR